MGDMCRCKWRRLAMVSKGSVFGEVELMQREGKNKDKSLGRCFIVCKRSSAVIRKKVTSLRTGKEI